jgi:hypothetical protein
VERTCLRGLAGAMRGADTAIKANSVISTNPATVKGLRRQAGRRDRTGIATVSAIVDPRVEPVIPYIHDEVGERVNQCRE